MNEAEIERRVEEQQAFWREHGIAGVLTVGLAGLTLTGYGPNLPSRVVLYAMEDGTVRWKQP